MLINLLIHYNLELEEVKEDEDGWTVSVNKKSQRSRAHGIAKRKLFSQIEEIKIVFKFKF